MRYVRFRVVEDENYGGHGILPDIFRNWNNYSPLIAVRGLGHDLIEHGCREIGAFHQEVAATGSYLFVRLLSGNGMNGMSMQTPHQLAASNLTDNWQESTIDNFPTPPKVRIPDDAHTEMFDDFVNELRPVVKASWTSEAYDLYLDNDECPYTSDENWPKFVGWLRYGYARAYRRFDGDDYLAYRLYKNINNTIEQNWDKLAQYSESGRVFTLALDKTDGSVELWGLDW